MIHGNVRKDTFKLLQLMGHPTPFWLTPPESQTCGQKLQSWQFLAVWLFLAATFWELSKMGIYLILKFSDVRHMITLVINLEICNET